ncbi:restriction endonuclease subunit S [Psychrobacter sp. UBA3962]|uniref:restriction endonuclease subunit S n=1 Tax=Psychrobacter sp. UBA3962 TaxID=1947352 RepID=UPI0025EBD7CC|nr:restriction endonuclease subunit S [Psychrobacter sp. UBA3962]
MVDSSVMQSGRYKAYPEYKGSGIEWIGEIPSDWDILSLKRCVDGVTNGIWGSEPNGHNDLVVLRVADFDRNRLVVSDEKLTYRSITAKEAENRLLTKGDLLIEKSGGGDTTLVGCVVLFDKNYPAVTSNFVAKMTPNHGYSSRFLLYAFSLLYDGRVNFSSIKQTTGIQNLDSDAYLMEKFCFPTEESQEKIANFLDYETAKIDTLIEKQQRLIELLTEKRQAVISHAVTKGLNPDVPMKDSGVEWLGEVPEHWEVKRFKTIFKIRKRIAGELGHDVLSITQKGIKIKDTESGEGQLSMDYSKYQLVYKGDYAMNHMDLLTGFVDISKYDGVTSPDYRVFTLEEKNSLPEYFLAFLQMGYINKLFFPFGQGAAHMGRWRLPTEAFREFLAPVPPKNEQKAIADFIFNSLEQMDILEKKSRKAIKLMQERRTALISAAVTGKIDVRDWVKPE